MNPDNPQSPREQLEARLTAFLLGEASADEAAELRQAIKDDPQLAELYHRLEETIHLVREAGPAPSAQSTPQPAPLKLSDDRREKLLAQFKTVAPKEFARPQKRPHQRTRFDTFIEIAAVLVLVGVLAGMLLPALSRSKSRAMYAERAPAKLAELKETHNDRRETLSTRAHQPKVEQELLGRSNIEAKKGDEQQPMPGLTQSTSPVEAPPVQTRKQEIFLPSSNETVEAPKELVQKLDSSGLSITTGEERQPVAPEFPRGFDNHKPAGIFGGMGGGGAGGRGGGSNAENPVWIGTLDQQEARQFASNQFVGRYAYIANPAGSNLDIDAIHNQAQPLAATPPALVDAATGLPVSNNDANTFYRNTTSAESNTGMAGAPVSETYSGGINGQAGQVASIPGALGTPPPTPEPGSAPPVNFSDNLVVSKDAAATSEQIPVRYANAANISTSLESLNKPSDINAEQPATARPDQANVFKYNFANRGADQNPAWALSDAGVLAQSTQDREKLASNIANDGELKTFDNSKKVPVLGDMPTLGAAFKSSNKSENDAVKVTNGIALPQLAASDVISGYSPGPLKSLGKSSTAEPPAKYTPPSIPVRTLNPVSLRADLKPIAEAATNVTIDPQTHQVIVIADDKSLSNLDQAVASMDKQRLGGFTTGTTVRQLAELKLAGTKSAPVNEAQLIAEDRGLPHPATPAAIPQPEVQTSSNAFSTFSLNVSDVSFKLAAASLEKGVMPDPATVRSEEFINAFDYRDPAPPPGAPVGFSWERSQDPFAQNRDLLRFSVQTAAAGREPGRPLNLVLLLDNSGSMERADRVQIIHEALRVLATQLQPQDTLSVVTFARTPRLWVDGVPGSQAGDVAEKVSGLTPQGGTNLEDAMKLAYETALRHYLANGVNRVVLLTDGAANLGNVDPTALKQKVETNRKQGIALDCFGIGWEGYNDDLLEVLSRNGDGRYGFLNTPEEAATGFAGQLAGALHVAAADVKVQVEFNPARVNSYRQIGYAKHQLTKQQFRDNTVDAAEIGAAESGNALYTVEVNPQGDGPLATVRVRYKVPATGEYREQAWPVPYTGASAPLDKSSPAMRLSATASEFSEWLASSPYAQEVTPDQLLGYLAGAPEFYGADARPKKLEWMLRQAKSLSGK